MTKLEDCRRMENLGIMNKINGNVVKMVFINYVNVSKTYHILHVFPILRKDRRNHIKNS